MFKLHYIPAVLVLCITGACVGWQGRVNDVAAEVHKWGHATAQTVLPMVNAKCRSEAVTCAKEGNKDCPRWHTCDEIRDAVKMGLMALQFAVVDAKLAADLGNEQAATDAAEAALSMMSELVKQLTELGVL